VPRAVVSVAGLDDAPLPLVKDGIVGIVGIDGLTPTETDTVAEIVFGKVTDCPLEG